MEAICTCPIWRLTVEILSHLSTRANVRLTSEGLWTLAAAGPLSLPPDPPSLSPDPSRCRRTPSLSPDPPRCRRICNPAGQGGITDPASAGPSHQGQRTLDLRSAMDSRCRRTPLLSPDPSRCRRTPSLSPDPLAVDASPSLSTDPPRCRRTPLAAAGSAVWRPRAGSQIPPQRVLSLSPERLAVAGFVIRRARAGSQIPPQRELRTGANARLTSHPLWTIILAVAGCGAGGSARRLGRRGRRFKSYHPD